MTVYLRKATGWQPCPIADLVVGNVIRFEHPTCGGVWVVDRPPTALAGEWEVWCSHLEHPGRGMLVTTDPPGLRK